MNIVLYIYLTFFPLTDSFCQCAPNGAEELMDFADYAVVGQAIKNVHPDRALIGEFDTRQSSDVILFQIKELYKGTVISDSIVIDQRGTGNCKQGFEPGKNYLIFGFKKRMIPSSIAQRNNDYVVDDILSDREVDLDRKLSDIEDFFNQLSDKYTSSYSDGCFIFSSDTEIYKEIMKTAGNPKK